jgi:glycosyltransferase involved in cell wall biosynthesis
MATQGRLLIISQGPFPTPEQPHVEGGGLRCWGLAQGLRDNLPELSITLAYREAFRKPGHAPEYRGFPIITWDDETLPRLIQDYDSVLISYCMGPPSEAVAAGLRPDQQLILDCYVPIYVEVSARSSSDVDREMAAFAHDIRSWNRCLERGDVFLCASAPQARFYQGVLSALGRINPITYGKSLILEVPYGIYREEPTARDRPISRMVGEGEGRKILWFGGIYPWFDLKGLIDAVALVNRTIAAKLVIVGARNPFTCHPDFLAKYDELDAYANRPEHRDLVMIRDWVPFDERGDWYLDADLVVMVNKPGDENGLSWRTRLVDFVWANVPMITNGGDPLGEDLIARGAAARFPDLDPRTMAETLVALLQDPAALGRLRAAIAGYKSRLYWDVATRPLAEAIAAGERAPDLLALRSAAPAVIPAPEPAPAPPDPEPAAPAPPPPPQQHLEPRPVGRVRRFYRLARKVPRHLRTHGFRATSVRIREKLARHLPLIAPRQRGNGPTMPAGPVPEPGHDRRDGEGPRILVLTHMLDHSGAPLVLLDVVDRLARERLPYPIRMFSYRPWNVEPQLRARVEGLGIQLQPLDDWAQCPRLGPGDVVLMNTVDYHPHVKETIFGAAERDEIRKVIWFIHEDEPESHFSEPEARRVRRLVESGRLEILAPARQICDRYRRHLGADITCEPLRVEVPAIHEVDRGPEDFETLRFVLAGRFADCRKGQLSVLYAFAAFYHKDFTSDPAAYRDFTLTFIGIEDDFMSRQVLRHGGILGDRLVCHPRVSRDRSLEIIRSANVTICYSLREAFGLFVIEGMFAGHPLLRNDCSGLEEQLEPGRNGFLLENDDFWQVVGTIERILNRRKTSNEQLAAMSARSRAIAARFQSHDYDGVVRSIRSAIRGTAPAIRPPHFPLDAARRESSPVGDPLRGAGDETLVG